MTNVLNPVVTARLIAALGTVLFSVIAVFAFVWTIGHAALFCFAVYGGHTGGPELVVSPVLAVAGTYLFTELVKEVYALWR